MQNRLPTKALKDQTPFEAWYGYKPSLHFLKIFGCLCFTHVPHIKKDKLDKRALPSIFIGYSSITKAYEVFQPQTGNIVISRDVHFVENAKWNWEDTEQSNRDWKNDMVDDVPIRGTRLLSNVYQRCHIAICEHADYEEAMKNKNWVLAMKEELSMIEKNKTWILVDRPKDKVIGIKWVYRTRLDANGSINKNKARLVVKYFGVDYSIRLLQLLV